MTDAEGGVTIIPVSKVSFGFATGGADMSGKEKKDGSQPFGAGSGAHNVTSSLSEI